MSRVSPQWMEILRKGTKRIKSFIFVPLRGRLSSEEPHTMEENRILLAYERIMEDPSLTADLVDEDAKVLLTWAEDEIKRIIAGASRLEPEAAERTISQQLRYLRRYLRRISRRCGSAENPAEMLEMLLVSPDYPQDEENVE